jgi:hypothetical protein
LSDADFAMFAYFQLSPLRHRRHIIFDYLLRRHMHADMRRVRQS